MLRDILRLHPNLVSPEETHFFRWGWPFHTDDFNRPYLKGPVLRKHQEIDGIAEKEFATILGTSASRGDLARRYMTLFASKRKPSATRWYDKTPQNVYGMPLIMAEFPEAKFVHIIRNPVDVVTSLRIGRVMKVSDLVGAANYWREAVASVGIMKQAFPDKIMEFKYEDFTKDWMEGLRQLLTFVDEAFDPLWFSNYVVHPKNHRDSPLLNAEEISRIRDICEPWISRWGYT
jgi:hypothetical protein